MRECSYCGHANEDAADVCAGCGMAIASTTEARMEARLSDPAEVLVIVRIFNTMEEASLLAGRLSASGIEAWIPESGAQPFSSVMAFAHFTVWVAAKDQEEAETIAAEMESSGLQTVSLPSAQGRRALTWRGMSVITVILVSAPIVAGLVTHSIRETPAMGPVFWTWMVLSVCCLWWARYALRRFRLLGWSCMAIDLLQMALFVIVFLTVDFPENARSQPDTQQHNVNSHNW